VEISGRLRSWIAAKHTGDRGYSKASSTDHRKSRPRLKQEVRQERKGASSKLDVVPIVEGVFGRTYVLNMWWAYLLNQILVLDALDTFANDLRLLVGFLTFRTAPPWIARLLVFRTSYQVNEWLHWSGMLHEFNEIMVDAHLSYCWMIDVLDLFNHVLLYTLSRRWRSEGLMLDPYRGRLCSHNKVPYNQTRTANIRI